MPTRSSSSTVRSWASASGSPSCSWICSTIWSPIFWTGFSEVIGSWKIIAISAPRTRRSSSSEAAIRSLPLYSALPSKLALGERVRPSSVMAVTDLPEPDSPTTASTSPAASSNETPSTAWTAPSSVANLTRRSRTSSSRSPLTAAGSGDRGRRT